MQHQLEKGRGTCYPAASSTQQPHFLQTPLHAHIASERYTNNKYSCAPPPKKRSFSHPPAGGCVAPAVKAAARPGLAARLERLGRSDRIASAPGVGSVAGGAPVLGGVSAPASCRHPGNAACGLNNLFLAVVGLFAGGCWGWGEGVDVPGEGSWGGGSRDSSEARVSGLNEGEGAALVLPAFSTSGGARTLPACRITHYLTPPSSTHTHTSPYLPTPNPPTRRPQTHAQAPSAHPRSHRHCSSMLESCLPWLNRRVSSEGAARG